MGDFLTALAYYAFAAAAAPLIVGGRVGVAISGKTKAGVKRLLNKTADSEMEE